VSAKFKLDNGKLREYATCWGLSSAESSDEIYRTKCGLRFDHDPKDGACDHLDCAIDAARHEAIIPVAISCLFPFTMFVIGWHCEGDILAAVRGTAGIFIILVSFSIPFSIFPFKRWLELREYKNHGTIYRRMAHRL
jgi:hypothetical protein